MKPYYLFLIALLICYIECKLYVDLNHEDCTNTGNGDISKPFCHIQHALDYLQSSIDIEPIIEVGSGIYNEILTLPDVEKVEIQGRGDMLPIIKSIRQEKPIHNFTISYFQFTSNITQLHFEHSDISYLNIHECLFSMLPSEINVPIIKITPRENITIKIKDSIIQAIDTETEVIVIPDSINSSVLISNTSIWANKVTFEKIINLEIIESLIYTPYFNIHNSNSFISRNIFYLGGLNIDSYALTNIFDNRFIQTHTKILSDCIDKFDICASTIIISGNIYESNSTIHFYKEKSNPESTRLFNLIHNLFTTFPNEHSVINDQRFHVVNASRNYWDDITGPSICSNPGGQGASVSLMVDYSNWCLSKNCTSYAPYPELLDSTITTKCNTYKGGTIASIVIFSLIFIIIFGAAVFIYNRFCSSEKATEEDTLKHNIKVFSMLSAILTFLFIWFPIVAKGIGNSCQTRVPAMTCVITTTDSSLASLMLLLWLFALITNIGLMYVSTNHLIHRGSIYFSIFLSKLLIIVIPFVIMIDIMVMIDRYLSSKVMIFPIICFILTIITEIFLLIKVYKLRNSVTTFTILVNDEEVSIQRSLLYQGNIENAQDEMLVSDGIFILSYGDYKKRTQRNLLLEAISLGLLFILLIWFTIKFKVLGALSFINIIGNILRVAFGFYVVRTTKSYAQYDLYFIICLGFTATTSILTILYLFFVLYQPSSNVSIYFVLSVSYTYLILSLLSIEKTTAFKRSVAAQIDPSKRQQQQGSNNENVQQNTFVEHPQNQEVQQNDGVETIVVDNTEGQSIESNQSGYQEIS